ncbi:MAG: S8 family serine peptidase [Acidimicrobiales bacterium]
MAGRRLTLVAASALVAALVAFDGPGVAAQAGGATDGPTVPIVVLADRPVGEAQVSAATGGQGEIVRTVPAIGATVIEVPAASAARSIDRLDAARGVEHAYRPGTAHAFDVTPNDPQWFRQDSLRGIHLPTAWSTSTGSSSTVIGIVDSGVNEVGDLTGRVLAGTDIVNGDSDPADDAGHGTDSALVAAAAGNDSAGAAGVCWSCRVLPVKVLDSDGSGSMFDVAQGIVWATDHGADVINLSLGGEFNDPAVTSALSYAFAHDVVVVASAGNDGTTVPNYPAADAGVISVAGATDARGLWSWSQRGPTWVDVAAPGCNWTFDDVTPFKFCGTSAAAPVVTGLAALLRSVRPAADRQMVATAIDTTADFAATRGLVGYGIVDAAAAVAAIPTVAAGPTPLPPDVTPPRAVVSTGSGYQSGVTSVRVYSADDQRVALVELWVDGVQISSTVSPPPALDLPLDTRGYGDGRHSVQAVAVDAAGQRTAAAAVTIAVDNANPLGLLVSPGNGATVTGSFVARAYVNDPNGIMGTFLIANDAVVGGFLGAGFGEATVPVRAKGAIRVVALTVDNAGHISATNTAYVQGVVARRRTRR